MTAEFFFLNQLYSRQIFFLSFKLLIFRFLREKMIRFPKKRYDKKNRFHLKIEGFFCNFIIMIPNRGFHAVLFTSL